MVFITLAAGKGTRLGSLAKLTPKTLFQVGANQRICDTHKNLARALKITHWYLVAGKQITQIKRVVTGETNPIARVLYNPLHASPSPLYSLARTIPLLMLQDAVIANGDTLYSPKLAHSIKKQLAGVSLYLSHSQSAEADMKILLNQEGRVSQAVTPSKTGMHVSSGLVVVRGVRYRALFILAIL